MHGIPLVLVLAPLAPEPFGPFHPPPHLLLGGVFQRLPFAHDVPDHPAQQRALSAQHTPHPLELLGMG
ncbi:hypothetical protein ATB54_16180 [Xanthomonas translucens]|nr:hypothetical protein ATB54_16180 [Xanthomonas translucens]